MKKPTTKPGTMRVVGVAHVLKLDWIPTTLKNKKGVFFNKTLKRIVHYRRSEATEDMEAIRSYWLRPLDPISATYRAMPWSLDVTVHRPLSKAEAKDGHTNKRRGDLVSAHELVCDALQGLWYDDDSQIVMLTVREDRSGVGPAMTVVGHPLMLREKAVPDPWDAPDGQTQSK